jgi:hypothetical protein
LTPINLRLYRQSILFSSDRARVPPRPVGLAHMAIGSRTPGDPDMSEDIIVFGGLAAVFCWTYIFLPLIYHYS